MKELDNLLESFKTASLKLEIRANENIAKIENKELKNELLTAMAMAKSGKITIEELTQKGQEWQQKFK